MSDLVIRVKGLGKQYKIGARQERTDTLRDALIGSVRRLAQRFSGNGQHSDEDMIWALKDVSFEVKRGEVLGVIGRNGAGKSTLLKILSRITEPTTGEVDLHGRVASLLEVGTGFHAELTGRENIYLNGAILGMKRREIQRNFDEIVDFAGVEKFVDTPVKHYSSGMYLRLAFAVAAHMEPDILLVDEVLAVGDAEFQKKCLGKMGDIAREGRTVLLVTHNMLAVQHLCHRALLIGDGQLRADDTPSATVKRYLGGVFVEATERRWEDLAEAPGDDVVRLHSVRLVTRDGVLMRAVRSDQDFGIEIQFVTMISGEAFNVGLHLTNEEQIHVFSSVDNNTEWHERPRPAGIFKTTCYVPANLLAPGTVTVMAQVKRMRRGDARIHARVPEALKIDIEDAGDIQGNVYLQYVGVIRPALQWHTEYKSTSELKATGLVNA